MPYTGTAIANELLDIAESDSRPLTQINIQKLLYFAHGWFLALTKQPLVDEAFMAWEYGPVVRSVYDEFRSFGSAPITTRAKEWQINDRSEFVHEVAALDSGNENQDTYAKALIQRVWDQYGTISAFKLVEITHLPGGPWAQAIEAGERFIDNEQIRLYFEHLAAEGATA